MKLKKLLRPLAFLVLLALLFTVLYRVFRLKLGGDFYSTNGIESMEIFYEQPENSIDVLVLGSSHAYKGISPGVLYSGYGVTSYDLSASSQAIWNTYYYFREALKTQSPKLVVLEASNLAVWQQDYTMEDNSTEIIASLYGMKWSANKLAAIRASSASLSDTVSILLEWTQYHGRYLDLTEEDYLPYKGNETYYKNWKGYEAGWEVKSYASLNPEPTAESEPLSEKNERYYRAILDLAQQNGIPVLVITAPYPNYAGGAEKKYYNTISAIAAQYGDAFIDFNTEQYIYDELGLDTETDFADSGHLNYSGAVKFSDWLGSYLSEAYSLPDHRGDSAYASWQTIADYDALRNETHDLTKITDMGEYLTALAETDNDYTVLISVANSNAGTALAEKFAALGITDSASYTNNVWAVRGGEVLADAQGADTYLWTQRIGYDDLAVQETGGSARLLVGDTNYASVANGGFCLAVYDNLTGECVDSVGGYEEYGYALERR